MAANLIGINRSTLAGIEAGHDLPGRKTLIALADFYGVSLDGLFADAGPPSQVEYAQTEDESAILRFWRGLDEPCQKLIMLALSSVPDR